MIGNIKAGLEMPIKETGSLFYFKKEKVFEEYKPKKLKKFYLQLSGMIGIFY